MSIFSPSLSLPPSLLSLPPLPPSSLLSLCISIERYSVIPLSPNSGLIGWVPHCDTIHSLIRDYREKKKIMLNIEHRLMLQVGPRREGQYSGLHRERYPYVSQVIYYRKSGSIRAKFRKCY